MDWIIFKKVSKDKQSGFSEKPLRKTFNFYVDYGWKK